MTTRGEINSNFYQVVNIDGNGNITEIKPEFIGNVNYANHANYADVANLVAGSNVSGDVAGANHANIADIANLVAGANVTGTVALATYATTAGSASSATTAGTVTTNAQPNITSLGTLTTLNVTGSANLGNVGNVKITGGANNYILKTDGLANLTWIPFTTPAGGSNSQIQYNNLGALAGNANLTFNAASGRLTATRFTGNGEALTSLTGANVTGAVAYATTANAVAGANVSGAVAYATTANAVAGANVSGEVSYAATANAVAGANVTGIVANATYATTAGSASSATTAGTVTTNAQPNITSVGSLTGLTVSNATGIVDFTTTANVTLGAVANLHIAGGTAGYVLKTDGTGNLTWIAAATGTPAGSNTQIQFNDGGSFGANSSLIYDKTSNTLSVIGGTGLTAGINTTIKPSNIVISTGGGIGNLSGAKTTLTTNSIVRTSNVTSIAYIQGFDNIRSANGSNAITIYNANTTVTNLVANTIGGNLNPNANVTYSLGNSTNRWTDLYLSNSTIYLGAQSISATATGLSMTGILSGDAGQVSNVVGANVTGQVANASVAGTVYTAAQPNITSVGTLTSLAVTGNISTANDVTALKFLASPGANEYVGYGFTGAANVDTAMCLDATDQITFYNNAIETLTLYANNSAKFFANLQANNYTGNGNSLSMTAGANVSGAVSLATYATTANAVAGANVSGTVANATYATTAGTANSVAGANVSGAVAYATTANSVAGANVSGTVANATYATTAGTANSVAGANVSGTVANATYATTAGTANSVAGANVSGAVAYATTANAVAGANVSGTVANATYATTAGTANSVAGANVSGQVANALIAGTVYTAAQPNITSVGTLTSLNVTGNITGNAVQLRTSTGVTTANTGAMFWDATEQTVTIGMNNGVQQQVGLETYVLLRASATITNGQVVMWTGSAGEHVQGAPANTSSVGFRPAYVLGVATQDITINTDGYITTFGLVHDINTNAYNAGDLLYLSPNTSGQLTSTEPTAPDWRIEVATVTKKSATGHIRVSLRANDKVGNLSDASITSPTAGQALIYNSSNVWVNGNPNIANIAYSVAGANVSGQVANALIAGTVYTAAQPNITSVGSLTGLVVSNATGTVDFTTTANVTLGSISNLHISGGTANYVLKTDGSGTLSWVAQSGGGGGASISNGTSNVNIATSDGNVTIGVTGTANIATFTGTGANIIGNIRATTGVSGTTLTSNVATGTAPLTVTSTTRVANLNVAQANIASYVTTAATAASSTYYPLLANSSFAGSNISPFTDSGFTWTSGGSGNLTLTGGASISVGSGNITAAGNLIGDVRSNVFTVSTSSLTTNTPFNFTQTWNNTSATFTGIKFNATNTLSGASSLLMDLQLSTVSQFSVDKVGNVTGNYFIGNGSALTGVTSTPTPAGSNTYIQFNDASALGANSQFTYNKTTNTLTVGNVAATITTAAQTNITSVGTLTSLAVTGNITSGNANLGNLTTSNYFTGTLTTAAQPNITSVGTLTSLAVTGNITSGNANLGNLLTANYFSGGLLKFNEKVVSVGNSTANLSAVLDANSGSIFQVTANVNTTMNTIPNAVAGTSATIIITQDATGSRTLTSSMKFAGATKTLSTAASSIDIISVFYDGTTYYASLTKGYA